MIISRTIHVHGYFTHRVTCSPFIWGKYLDQPLRVTCSDLKILFPPLFSIDKEQPERKEREIIYVSELQSLDRNFFFLLLASIIIFLSPFSFTISLFLQAKLSCEQFTLKNLTRFWHNLQLYIQQPSSDFSF